MTHLHAPTIAVQANHSIRLRAAILGFLILLIGTATYFFEGTSIAVGWKSLGDDLEIAEVPVAEGGILSPQVTLIRTSRSRYRIAVIPASRYGGGNATVKRLATQSGALLGINANFFDEHGKPLGVVLNRGNQLQPLHRGGHVLTGIFQVTRDQAAIVGRDNFAANGVLEAVQAGPRLIVNGQVLKTLRDIDSYERRSGICIDQKKNVIFYISSGIMGISFRELVKILLQPDVACQEALNLDGGGSAQLYVSTDLPGAAPSLREISLPGSDAIPVMLGLLAKTDR